MDEGQGCPRTVPLKGHSDKGLVSRATGTRGPFPPHHLLGPDLSGRRVQIRGQRCVCSELLQGPSPLLVQELSWSSGFPGPCWLRGQRHQEELNWLLRELVWLFSHQQNPYQLPALAGKGIYCGLGDPPADPSLSLIHI